MPLFEITREGCGQTNLSKTHVWRKSDDIAIDFKRAALLCVHA